MSLDADTVPAIFGIDSSKVRQAKVSVLSGFQCFFLRCCPWYEEASKTIIL